MSVHEGKHNILTLAFTASDSPEGLRKHDTANSPPEQGAASVYLDSGDMGANMLHPSSIEPKMDDIPLLPGMPAGVGKSQFPELQNRCGMTSGGFESTEAPSFDSRYCQSYWSDSHRAPYIITDWQPATRPTMTKVGPDWVQARYHTQRYFSIEGVPNTLWRTLPSTSIEPVTGHQVSNMRFGK